MSPGLMQYVHGTLRRSRMSGPVRIDSGSKPITRVRRLLMMSPTLKATIFQDVVLTRQEKTSHVPLPRDSISKSVTHIVAEAFPCVRHLEIDEGVRK